MRHCLHIQHNRKSADGPAFCELGSIRVAFFHHCLHLQFSRMNPLPSHEASRFADWSRGLWLSAILLCGLLVMSRSKADPDLWGHVQYGKEVIRDGYLHPSTTWSYAVEGYRWVNHENVAELVLAAADMAAGQTGLLLLKSILTLVILGLPLWYAQRRGAGLLASAAMTTILAFGISFHWLIRPHMLSYASAAVLICLLAVGCWCAECGGGSSETFGRGKPMVVAHSVRDVLLDELSRRISCRHGDHDGMAGAGCDRPVADS